MESQGVMSMTAAEAKRLYVIQQVMERKLRQRPAAELVHRSVRQIRRLVQRVRQEGPPASGAAGAGHPATAPGGSARPVSANSYNWMARTTPGWKGVGRPWC